MAKGPHLGYLFPHTGWNRLTIVLSIFHLTLVAFLVINERNSINFFEQFDDEPAVHQFWEWATKKNPKSWAEVEKSDGYRALDSSERTAAKQQYLREVIAQKPDYKALSPEQQRAVDAGFLGPDGEGPWEDYMTPQEKLVLQGERAAELELKPRFGNISKFALLPPLALALVIYSGLWVYRGFRTAR